MKTRELVTGKYSNARTYILYQEDGSVFQTITEGESFRIENQMREWIPVRVPNKFGKGTILMCQKFGDNNNVIEEFSLVNNKKGLWALTSGAARTGVFHKYYPPMEKIKNKAEIANRKWYPSPKFEIVSEIEYTCNLERQPYRDGFYDTYLLTDGTTSWHKEVVTIKGGTYCITKKHFYDTNLDEFVQVTITDQADPEVELKELG